MAEALQKRKEEKEHRKKLRMEARLVRKIIWSDLISLDQLYSIISSLFSFPLLLFIDLKDSKLDSTLPLSFLFYFPVHLIFLSFPFTLSLFLLCNFASISFSVVFSLSQAEAAAAKAEAEARVLADPWTQEQQVREWERESDSRIYFNLFANYVCLFVCLFIDNFFDEIAVLIVSSCSHFIFINFTE